MTDAVYANGFDVAVCDGVSMHPAIRRGERVLVVPPTEAVQPGDIVVVELNGRLVMHRVLAVGPHDITTRGDNAPLPECWPRSQLAGRVVHKLDADGRTVPVPRAPGRARRMGVAVRFRLGCLRRVLRAMIGRRPDAPRDTDRQ